MNKAERNSVVRQLVVQTLVWLAITGALLFAAAGTVRWPEAWAYLGLWLAGAVVSGSLLVQKNPDILKERMRSPMQSQQKRWDRPLLVAIFGGWAALQIVAGLDAVRYRWSHMPLWLEIAGALAVVLGIYVFHIVMLENSYASPVVKVDAERGHRVVSSGPYAWVRHPMYAGAILYFLGTALLLGSWYAFAIGIVLIVIIALRAVWEEETLKAELPGYADYASRVKYRLVPGVW
jgi:protein-S-isoprenylcysteine O-methyltransferase Ste14